jgi:hypothetical protein
MTAIAFFTASWYPALIATAHLMQTTCSGLIATPHYRQNFLCPVGLIPQDIQATAVRLSAVGDFFIVIVISFSISFLSDSAKWLSMVVPVVRAVRLRIFPFRVQPFRWERETGYWTWAFVFPQLCP